MAGEQLVVTTPEGKVIGITIIDIRGKSIRVGISADKDVLVYRKEIQDKIDEAKKGA